jgi:putative ABC transport system permease protein
MFKHLFKLIWNKKKQNFLLISEMLVSFLVIFAVFTLLVYYYQNYKKPIGIEYENLWTVSYNNANKTTNTDSLNTYYENMRKTVLALPMVEDFTFCSNNIPFSQSTWQSSASYKKNTIKSVNRYSVEDNYPKTMGLKLLQGRWFNKSDVVFKNRPVIIDNTLKEKLFGDIDAIGKIINQEDGGKGGDKVIGIVQGVKKDGDYADVAKALYSRTDTGSFRDLGKAMIKVRPGADAAFEGKLYKTLANYMKDSNIEIEHMTAKRKSTNYFTLVPMIVLLIVASFLVINVALGLFGVLWYNINRRKGEIGLRRAIGASGASVSSQLVSESMILATLSLIIGAFFAVQFPILNVFNLPASIYIIAMFLAIVFIYLLVLVCSLYPGRQAAAIYPAVALHEE